MFVGVVYTIHVCANVQVLFEVHFYTDKAQSVSVKSLKRK